MRERFNLDITDLSRMTFLIHGNFGVGKTALLGDFLKHEASLGKSVRFLNVKGEDGWNSIANLGLGNVGETVDTFKDFNEALTEYAKDKVDALAIDGMKHFGKLIIKHNCGDRLPSVGKGSDDWQKIHKDFEDTIGKLRWIAPTVVCAASSDRSMDQISGEITLTPDFPGRQAAGSGGMFDFVFVLKAASLGPGKGKRVLQTAPVANTVIRARAPRPLPHEIELPWDGPGAWQKVKETIQKAYERKA